MTARLYPVVLFRPTGGGSDFEEHIISGYFRVVYSRLDLRQHDLVIARYSALPYYNELAHDAMQIGAHLINDYSQHAWLADAREWAGFNGALSGLTPAAWALNEFAIQHAEHPGPFVVKGQTNSRKFAWNTRMFAPTRSDVGRIAAELMQDSLIGQQEIVVRPYVPLRTFLTAENGLPITNEYRFFVYRGKVLSGGYYWTSHIDEVHEKGFDTRPSQVPRAFLEQVVACIGRRADFYAVDVAQKVDGGWMVVELNDGQMSGLSDCAPEELWRRLAEELKRDGGG